ncbi:head GIN domain-containing protein [Sungkyunkwania multivorans]|uniref:Head GIN domain-containing protein n=1 Tax=Sungkyunkwania multivorans TaxID=1173618 RepID=A0ABW3CZS2_9FLAO
MKKILVFIALACSAMVTAQDSSKTVQLEDFNEIKVFDGISVTLIKADENKAVISGEDISDVALVIRNGRLKVRMEIDKVFTGHRSFVEIYYKDRLDVIDVNENAFLSSEDVIEQTSIELKAQEGAEMNVRLDTQKVDVLSTSGGKIEATGDSITQDVIITSGGQYEGDRLKTEQSYIRVNAGGTGYVNASELVEARVRAGGTVRIHGKPKVIDKKTFLGGKIIEMD